MPRVFENWNCGVKLAQGHGMKMWQPPLLSGTEFISGLESRDSLLSGAFTFHWKIIFSDGYQINKTTAKHSSGMAGRSQDTAGCILCQNGNDPTTDPGSPSKEWQQVASEKKTSGERTIEDRKYAKGAGTKKEWLRTTPQYADALSKQWKISF